MVASGRSKGVAPKIAIVVAASLLFLIFVFSVKAEPQNGVYLSTHSSLNGPEQETFNEISGYVYVQVNNTNTKNIVLSVSLLRSSIDTGLTVTKWEQWDPNGIASSTTIYSNSCSPYIAGNGSTIDNCTLVANGSNAIYGTWELVPWTETASLSYEAKTKSVTVPATDSKWFRAYVKQAWGKTTKFDIKTYNDDGSNSILDPWYSNNWTYRRNITISPVRENDLIELNLSAASVSCRPANCSDIRITDSSGNTLVDFQVIFANKTNGRNTSNWAKWGNDTWVIWTTGTRADTSYFIYYDNPNANDASTTILIWQDDFEKYPVGTRVGNVDYAAHSGDNAAEMNIQSINGQKGLQNTTDLGSCPGTCRNSAAAWNLSKITGSSYSRPISFFFELTNMSWKTTADPNFFPDILAEGEGSGYRIPQVQVLPSQPEDWQNNKQGGAPTCTDSDLGETLGPLNLTVLINGSTIRHIRSNSTVSQVESCRIEDTSLASRTSANWARGPGDLSLMSVRFFSAIIYPYSGRPNLTFGAAEPMPSTEAQGDDAIVDGIVHKLGTSAPIYSDQQLYLVYPNGTHALGTFDKVTTRNNQTWAFNYVTTGENLTGMLSLLRIVNIWENQSLTSGQITSQVELFINQTKDG